MILYLLTDILEPNIKNLSIFIKISNFGNKISKNHFIFILYFHFQFFFSFFDKLLSRSFCQSKMAARQAGIWLFISWLIMSIFHKLSCCCNFTWVVSTCVFFCLVLLMDGFASLIFIYLVFLHGRIIQDTRVYCRFIYWRFIGGSQTYT